MAGEVEETYNCYICGGRYTKGQPDEVALEECRQNFGYADNKEDLVMLCDRCYLAFMELYTKNSSNQ